MNNKPVVKKGERRILYAFAGFMDVLQIVFSFFVITEIINHVLDFVIAGILIIYAVKRKLLDTNKILILLAVFFGEQIPFVNALPFWVYDIHNIYKGIPSSEEEAGMTNTPGITASRNQRKPLNSTPGVRPPRLK